jgi:putative sterol carrier protein/NAD(P)-dependent dehydrogenase (short-subunit alcohol dehydrogenase family)
VKVAVTGSAGQLGTVVLRRLAVERGVTRIVSLDLRPPAVASAKVEHVRADVRDPEFARFLDGCDALVHLAFIVTGAPTVHAHGAMLARRAMVDVPAPLPLVWDEDVADAVALALKKEARGAFNLTAEPAMSARDLARACDLRLIPLPHALITAGAQLTALLAKLGVPDMVDPAWLRVSSVPVAMSSEKARRELGWKPKCPTPVEVVQRFLRENPSGLDRRVDLFFRMVQLAGRAPSDEARRVRARVHLRLTGPGGGDLGLVVDGGKLVVVREVPRPPTSTLTLRAATLVDILAGRTELTTAQLTGKLRLEGDPIGEMVLGSIIATFRRRAPRRLQRLLFKGASA